MTLKLLMVGKTDSAELSELIATYAKRLGHYVKFEMHVVPDLKKAKNLSKGEQKVREGEFILNQIQPSDYVILLDENGKQFSSKEFANELQRRMNSGVKNLVFIIGGAYGFSESVYNSCNAKISLSKMTFSHQMVRLFVVEQLYRAFTILRNEPYHHE